MWISFTLETKAKEDNLDINNHELIFEKEFLKKIYLGEVGSSALVGSYPSYGVTIKILAVVQLETEQPKKRVKCK